ncbi:MAG TPA: hypothetical protein ENO19_00620 [Halothiobacillaceae bacterium]|nr:hypothetical protein [Halothiobacillaceae bacterium]
MHVPVKSGAGIQQTKPPSHRHSHAGGNPASEATKPPSFPRKRESSERSRTRLGRPQCGRCHMASTSGIKSTGSVNLQWIPASAGMTGSGQQTPHPTPSPRSIFPTTAPARHPHPNQNFFTQKLKLRQTAPITEP